MSDLIQVRSKGRAPYWISRELVEKHPDDYVRVGAKKPAKPKPPKDPVTEVPRDSPE